MGSRVRGFRVERGLGLYRAYEAMALKRRVRIYHVAYSDPEQSLFPFVFERFRFPSKLFKHPRGLVIPRLLFPSTLRPNLGSSIGACQATLRQVSHPDGRELALRWAPGEGQSQKARGGGWVVRVGLV